MRLAVTISIKNHDGVIAYSISLGKGSDERIQAKREIINASLDVIWSSLRHKSKSEATVLLENAGWIKIKKHIWAEEDVSFIKEDMVAFFKAPTGVVGMVGVDDLDNHPKIRRPDNQDC